MELALMRLQMEIDRQVAWMLFWSLIATIISFWAGYEILKAAIRNGINGSDLVSRRRTTPTPQMPAAPDGYRWVLVKDDKPSEDLRAER